MDSDALKFSTLKFSNQGIAYPIGGVYIYEWRAYYTSYKIESTYGWLMPQIKCTQMHAEKPVN